VMPPTKLSLRSGRYAPGSVTRRHANEVALVWGHNWLLALLCGPASRHGQLRLIYLLEGESTSRWNPAFVPQIVAQ
jgi:hypothetical protein